MEDDSKINLDKGLLRQVGRLSPAAYTTWVHRHSLRSTYRLFDSDVLEIFSRTPWYVVPLIWVPVALLALHVSMTCAETNAQALQQSVCSRIVLSRTALSAPQAAFCVVMGVMIWTLIEYTLHRFVFHHVGSSAFSITFHFLLHGQHHKFPMDAMRLVFPPLPAAVLIALVYTIYTVCFPLAVARAILCGGLLGYVAYDLLHFYVHHGSPKLAYLSALKADHMAHHFRDHNKGFGISSKLWDIPFGTVMPQREERMRASN